MNRDERFLGIGDATEKFNALGTFAERNAKKGKSCLKSEPSALPSAPSSSSTRTDTGTIQKSPSTSDLSKSPSSPLASDGPESAGR